MNKPYEAISFTNKLGYIINPGDKIVIVTQGYGHAPTVRRGIYKGMRGKNCICTAYSMVLARWRKDGSRAAWNSQDGSDLPLTYRAVSRETTLRHNLIFPRP